MYSRIGEDRSSINIRRHNSRGKHLRNEFELRTDIDSMYYVALLHNVTFANFSRRSRTSQSSLLQEHVTNKGDAVVVSAQIRDENITTERSYPAHARILNLDSVTRWLARMYPGWRLGVTVGFYLSLLALVGNVVLLIISITSGEVIDGIGILAIGTPEQISTLGAFFHVLINIFSTLLLSASNYCMQVLSAPTRSEVDIAHGKGDYLDIGVLSIHNLRHINRRRQLLFWLLAVSSLPLHLFRKISVDLISDQEINSIYSVRQQGYRNLTNEEWPSIYKTKYTSNFGSLTMVIDKVMYGLYFNETTASFDITDYATAARGLANGDAMGTFEITWPQYQEKAYALKFNLAELGLQLGPADVDLASSIQFNPSTYWALFPNTTATARLRVQQVMARTIESGNKVQVVVLFIILVIICNVGKSVAMGMICFGKFVGDPLVIGGDAVASFLKSPERQSIGYCVTNKDVVLESWRERAVSTYDTSPYVSDGNVWHTTKYQLRKSISRRRANVFLAVMLTVTFLIAAALIGAFGGPKQGSRWNWGTSSELDINVGLSRFDAKGILMNTWLANWPQVVLSFVYFNLNSLLTLMYSAHEWNQYGETRKHLRVSTPTGDQRSSHFLQLPYRVIIPMTVYSGFLHWLLSQGFFLRRVEFYDIDGKLLDEQSLCTCGYSPLSILVFAICAVTGAAVILSIALVSFPQKMPFGANHSVVISAACHPPPDDVDPELKPVKWGVVRNRFSAADLGTSVPHCSFTSEDVESPIPGRKYA